MEHVHADGLLRCLDAQGRALLAHFAFQRGKDARMGERLLAYSVLAERQNDSPPVVSCVIYLNDIQTISQPPFILRMPDETVTTWSHYVCVQLGQIKAQELLALNRETLVPFLPLSEGGNTIEQVDIIVTKLFRENQPDLLWIGLSLAGKVLTKQPGMEWLRRRRAMLNGFLADSPIYQDVIAQALTEGEAKGRAEGEVLGRATEKLEAAAASRRRVASALSRLVTARFPAMEALVRECVGEPRNDHEVLLQLLTTVGSAQTEQEARQLLEARGNPT
ncbi:MAG TPA: hypothetical protein VGF67_23420 [Ktedonobacteraceae bacterium]